MRRDMFDTVESFSNAEFDKFSTASLITRSTNNITQIQMVIIMIIRLAFYAPITTEFGAFIWHFKKLQIFGGLSLWQLFCC